MPHAPPPNTARSSNVSKAALAVVALLACYLALGISAACRKSQTGDEGIHLAGGVSFWDTGDYRVQPASGNWPQHWCGLPVWLAGYELPSIDSPAWRDLSEWRYTEEFCYGLGHDVDRMLLAGRIMASVFALLLGIVIYCWSRALFGARAGLLSLALFVFSPTMLANGFLILADMASALFFAAAVGALWCLLHRVSLVTLLLSWFTLSGVFLVKFSGPMIVPMGLLLLVVRLLNPAPTVIAIGRVRQVQGRLAQLALFTGIGLLLVFGVAWSIWASFGFRYSLLKPDLGPPSREISWEAVKTKSRTVNDVIGFSRDHHLLPEAYLYGFSHTLHTADERAAYLNGAFRQRGWLSFFPYCLAYKTPLELFVVVVLAIAALIFNRPTGSDPSEASPHSLGKLLYDLSPLLVLFCVYWLFSLTSHLNIGHRHLLPTYPPLMILAGAAAWWLNAPGNRAPSADGPSSLPAEAPRRRLLASLASVVLVGALFALVAECLWFWPDYLAYFNVVAGGPTQSYRHLGDSSLDWSQDLKQLKSWLDRHPADTRDPSRLYFSFFGGSHPEYYGIQPRRLPSFPYHREPHVPEPLTGGTYIISATMLQCFMISPPGRWNVDYETSYQQVRQDLGTYLRLDENAAGREQLARIAPPETWDKVFDLYERLRFSRLASYLRAREPDDEIGYSILIYRLTDDDIDQALDGPPVEVLAEPEWQTENRSYEAKMPQ
ncbi:MAG TPA: hypothetical protein VGN12_21665 [Pirellulales bacterium]